MNQRVQDNLVAMAFLCVFLGIIIMSLNYGSRARMVPFPVAVIGVILSVIQLIWQNVRSTDELQVDLLEVLTKRGEKAVSDEKSESDIAAIPFEPSRVSRIRGKREAVAMGMIILFLGAILLLGPMIAAFIFTGSYFLLSKHWLWPKALIYAVSFITVIYLLFVVLLQIQFYNGLLEPFVNGF